jgi:hypothetical protein
LDGVAALLKGTFCCWQRTIYRGAIIEAVYDNFVSVAAGM